MDPWSRRILELDRLILTAIFVLTIIGIIYAPVAGKTVDFTFVALCLIVAVVALVWKWRGGCLWTVFLLLLFIAVE